jgi:uncharacterized phage protein (TIGR02218 family)
MRALPSNIASHLASGTTTLCTCWRLIRADGVVLGFTDHDRDLTFASTAFLAASGLSGSEVEGALGLAVGGGDLTGALTASVLTEADILAGRYDGASVETWLVNWADVSARLLLDVSRIGDIRRDDRAFTAETRSAAAPYDQEKGRLYLPRCDAEFGHARCGLSLAAPNRRVTSLITEVEGPSVFRVASPGSIAAGALAEGRAVFQTGAANGLTAAIVAHQRMGSADRITLDRQVTAGFVTGDAVQLTIGCDKRFSSCKEFGNSVNFRGFPHVPGTDQAFTYAERGSGLNDGGSLFS